MQPQAGRGTSHRGLHHFGEGWNKFRRHSGRRLPHQPLSTPSHAGRWHSREGVLLPTQSGMPRSCSSTELTTSIKRKKRSKPSRHLAVQIQKHFMVRNLAQLTGLLTGVAAIWSSSSIGKAMGNKVLR